MNEPWEEALDLDDSDLPSLRPFKHQNQHKTTATTTDCRFSRPSLQRCSILSQSDPNPQSSQNLLSQFDVPQQLLLPNSSPRLIPGPAGTVQAAMHRRKNKKNGNFMDLDEQPIPTQEYIRRVVEDCGAEDEDFSRDPWLRALAFIRSEGLVDGDGAIGTPLSAIKSRDNLDKVPQVIAIVKSCTTNGLGDMMVTLKDPTGIMDASIHHRVFVEGEFEKEISIGAVIILQKVAVFSPSRSAHYLNITLNNVVKVISKDSGAELQQNISTSTVKYAAPEQSEKLPMPQKPFTLSQRRTEGIIKSIRQNANNMRTSVNDDEQLVGDMATSGCHSYGINGNQNAVARKEVLLARHDVATREKELAIQTDTDTVRNVGREVCEKLKPSHQVARGDILEGAQPSSAPAGLIAACSNEEDRIINEVKLRQQPPSRASLPQWTDEQLDELFAFD